MESKKLKLTFITGNKGKLEEFLAILGEDLASKYEVNNVAVDLEEIQGESEKIAKHKAKLASTYCSNPVIVDDVSLCFNAFKGLPGPYVKCFLDKVGAEGLHKMVSPFQDQSGYALCTLAICESPEHEP
mmetsp:Transcript_10048/g.7545  ORF Transcript_10048/g.7545 Transcript_10048/m.7545 type:complete len:129 (+) Transcript_10048:39-425(+)